jgi:hypothetical protein
MFANERPWKGCGIEYRTGEILTIAVSNAVSKHCVECDNCLAAPAFILSVLESIDQQCVFYEGHYQRRIGAVVIELTYEGGRKLAAVIMKKRFTFALFGFVSQELLG